MLFLRQQRGATAKTEGWGRWKGSGRTTWEIKTVIRHPWAVFLSLCNNNVNKRVRGQRLKFSLENEGCRGASGCAYGRWNQADKLDSAGQPSRLRISSLLFAPEDWLLQERETGPFYKGFHTSSMVAVCRMSKKENTLGSWVFDVKIRSVRGRKEREQEEWERVRKRMWGGRDKNDVSESQCEQDRLREEK